MLPAIVMVSARYSSETSGTSAQSVSEMADTLVAQAEQALRHERKLLNNLPVVGREEEVRFLEKSFDDLVAGRSCPRVITISGPAGLGKTTLARRMRRKVVHHHQSQAFFLTGKFDKQNPRCEAYTGLASAMDELAYQILERDFDMSIRRRLQEAVGPEDADVLVEIFPSLYRVLSVERRDDGRDSPKSQRAKRRKFLFQEFFRALLSSKTYRDEDLEETETETAEQGDQDPDDKLAIVLHLDDLQWIDKPSLELLSSLVRDEELLSLLLVTTSRPITDEEHPFLREVARWKSQGIPVAPVELQDLDEAYINTIMSSLLDEEKSETQPLTNMIYRKTQGNPFFAVESLKTLVEENIVVFSYGDTCWKWDSEKVKSMLVASDDATSLVIQRLRRLDSGSRLILLVASCLKASFDPGLVEFIYKSIDGKEIFGNFEKPRSVEGSLKSFVEIGILARRGDRLVFVHDIMKQAVIDSLGSEKTRLLKLRVGQCILNGDNREDNSDDLSALLLVGVDLCNGSSDLLNSAEQLKLAAKSLLASEKAMRESAFSLSSKYAEAGLKLVEKQGATETSNSLYSSLLASASEASYCVGNFDIVRFNADKLLARECPGDVKLRALFLKIQSAMAMERTDEALDVGMEALKTLGIRGIPRRPSMLVVSLEIVRTRRLLRRHTAETLLELPLLTDKRRLSAAQCIDFLQNASYISDPNFFLVIFLTAMRWCIKYGITKFSPSLFAIYGQIQISTFRDTNAGVTFGK